ncbi:hypothetical protein CSB45_00130 [candidate division KSB3 bacterium]|uniref:Uncharacterized protein n=1 Tax=candidate division KSB3 bacterium TaxID=2044937 RepID=A0A2G6EFQ3_9BACT|nr:MAG: hypothetical protein CSB45_00130 [candidate division KSB3 bacterium]PIE31126.1 MAG: hypothetical protein CSA57_00215 [candidate division KSB3 bacterium]
MRFILNSLFQKYKEEKSLFKHQALGVVAIVSLYLVSPPSVPAITMKRWKKSEKKLTTHFRRSFLVL